MKNCLTVLLTFCLLLSAVAGAAAETDIQASGSGVVQAQPDCVTLYLGVNETDTDVAAAMTRTNKRIASIREALIAGGLAQSDIALGGLSIYSYADDGKEPQYSVSHQLTLTVRMLDQVGELIDAAIDAGANQLNGVDYTLENRGDLYDQALALAVQDARHRAEIIAKAAGQTITGIASIKEGGGDIVSERNMLTEDTAAGNTVLDTPGTTVNATVSVVFIAD